MDPGLSTRFGGLVCERNQILVGAIENHRIQMSMSMGMSMNMNMNMNTNMNMEDIPHSHAMGE
jgi:hypothetical protein